MFKNKADYNLYTKENSTLVFLIYVSDILIASNHLQK